MSEVTAVPLRPVAKGSLVWLWIGIGLALALGAAAAVWATAGQVAMAQPPAAILAANGKRSGVVTLPSGLEYEVLRPGAGPFAKLGDAALLNYEGRLADGSVFDSSAQHGGQPAQFVVGQVIPGFSEAMEHMNPGSKLRIWIPPELGYGGEDKPDPITGKIVIPANSLLVFDVEMLKLFQMPPAAANPGLSPGGMPR